MPAPHDLQVDLERLRTDFDAFRVRADERFAACQRENAQLTTAVAFLEKTVTKQTEQVNYLTSALLNMATGKIERRDRLIAENEDRTWKLYTLVVTKLASPVGKVIAALGVAVGGLITVAGTAAASIWLYRAGVAVPPPPVPAPVHEVVPPRSSP